MNSHKLYIDDEGVRRGYYVYLHRSTESGEVFYVGKGNGKRAWETENRNQAWKERVEKLNENWEVEIYEDDLTEIEAFRLEEKLVEDFGFFDGDNSQLTNHIPGGDLPASFSIGIGSGISDWQKAYNEVRKFKKLNQSDRVKLATQLQKDLIEVFERLWALDNEIDYTKEISEEEYDFLPGSVIGAIEDAFEASKDYPKKRISWKRFCLDVEYSYEYLTKETYKDEEINAKKFSDDLYNEFLKCRKSIQKIYHKIDSGNKKEAIKIANQASTNIPIRISSEIPNNANLVQLFSKMPISDFKQEIIKKLKVEGFKIETDDKTSRNIATNFTKIDQETSLKIEVKIEELDNSTLATLKGKAGIYVLDKKRSIESVWCKLKTRRKTFGKLAVVASKMSYDKIKFTQQ